MEVFETPGAVSLRIRIPSGRVVIGTTDEPHTEVELVPIGRRGEDAIEQIQISHEERSGRHIITIEQRNRIQWGPIQITWGGDVEVRVNCPVGTELDLSGASTDLRAEGTYGKVSARTASGDIRLGEVNGKLEVKTASGDVKLERVESDNATLATVSGDVEVGHAEGDLKLRTVSGDVGLGVARGPVTISTTSGDVKLESLEAGELRIQSVSGDSRIGVGRGTRIWVDASSLSGDLTSELTMGDDTPVEESDEQPRDIVPVHVKTVSGDVLIVRATVPVG
jgi:DUF4097 and DUF4098 domain-containing protein YvlB